jgi:hypothetical protein
MGGECRRAIQITEAGFKSQEAARVQLGRAAMEAQEIELRSRELMDWELEEVSGGKDYNLGFGIHLFKMGDYVTVYTDTKGPVVAT